MLTLKSSNPKMSWVLSKNPETQQIKKETFSRELRKGVIHGWFADAQTFKMLFIDHPTEMSFSDNAFEYLDRTRYCSPYLPVAAISELLKSAMSKKSEFDVEGYSHSFECLMDLKNHVFCKRLAAHLPLDIELTQVGKSPTLFKVLFNSEVGICELLNAVSTFGVLCSVSDENLYIPMDSAVCNKYAKALNQIKAPYYARHVFIRNAIRSPKAFEETKSAFENKQFTLNFGDTQSHRFEGIRKHLLGGSHLVDIGCGEMYYTRRLSKVYESILAYDADTFIQEKNALRLSKWGLEDCVTLKGAAEPSNLEIKEKSHVLLTEVIEHMEHAQAVELLKALSVKNFEKLVISVPNKDFNKHYLLEENQIRHWDHKWEPTELEFKELIKSVFTDSSLKIKFYGLGDAVGSTYASSLAVIVRI